MDTILTVVASFMLQFGGTFVIYEYYPAGYGWEVSVGTADEARRFEVLVRDGQVEQWTEVPSIARECQV